MKEVEACRAILGRPPIAALLDEAPLSARWCLIHATHGTEAELRGVAGNVPDVYEAFGIDLSDYKMAVLKTASNFQYFDRIASGLVRADTRGPGQSDVFTLPWQRIPRPVYPLETISDWRAHSSQPGAGKS